MAVTPQHRLAETRFRELLASADIPQPDTVEYEPAAVLFRWHARKLAVFVDFLTGEPQPAPAESAWLSDRASSAGACPPPPPRAAAPRAPGRPP
jgi:hypothetical protein